MTHKKDILSTIRRWSRSGIAVNYAAVRRKDNSFLQRACRLFGSWNAALKAAGINPDAVRRCPLWSKKEIIKQIRELHAKGAFPDIRTLSLKHSKLYWACCRFFGGGRQAVEAAGIDYEELLDQHPRRWTKGRIIAEIRRRKEEGKTLCLASIYRKEPKMRRFYYATMHQFKLWGEALKAAGLRVDEVRNNQRKWPSQRVLDEIRRRYAQGKLLNTELMLREDLSLHTAGRRHFGTWKKAVERAGINYSQYVRGGLYGWTRPKTLRALRDRSANNNCSKKTVQEQTPTLFRAAIHYFGSWEEAVRKARGFK